MERLAGGCLLVLAACLPVRAQPIILATEENPPANFTDPATGQVVGVAADKVRLLMDRAGLPFDLRVLPWPDAYALAQANPRACVFMANVTEERLPLFQWVAPLMSGGWALFSRADWNRKVDGPEDLRGVRIGVQDRSALEGSLRDLAMRVGGIILDTNPGAANLARLARGEVDLYAAGVWAGTFQARREGVPVRMVWRLSTSTGGMACHPGMDPEIIRRMQAALDSLVADGSTTRIDEAYGAPSAWSRGLGRP